MRQVYPFMKRTRLAGLGAQFVEATGDDTIFAADNYAAPYFYKQAEITAPSTPENMVNITKKSGADSKQMVNSIVDFGEWLRQKYPDVYNAAMMARPDLLIPEFALSGLAGMRVRKAMAGLAGLGADDTTTVPADTTPTSEWGKQAVDLLTKIAAPILQTYQQKKILDINIKRAEMGLPPIDETTVAPTVNVGVPPSQMNQIMTLGKYGLIGLLGLGALFVLMRKRR